MTLAEWLESTDCYEVAPIRARIGKTTYDGCRYKQRRGPEGQEYVQEGIYLLGLLPAAYERSNRLAFVLDGDDREWYVAGWVSTSVATNPEFARFHFEGNAAFQLMPWGVGGKVDDGEPRPYRRMVVTVDEAAAA